VRDAAGRKDVGRAGGREAVAAEKEAEEERGKDSEEGDGVDDGAGEGAGGDVGAGGGQARRSRRIRAGLYVVVDCSRHQMYAHKVRGRH
jgi:hypothetical protein